MRWNEATPHLGCKALHGSRRQFTRASNYLFFHSPSHPICSPVAKWRTGSVHSWHSHNNPVMHMIYFERQPSVITWYELLLVFNFRSFTGLRTRWERTTGGDSQISSPCHWRNGWQPFTGCNCFHSSVPHHWGQFPLWYNLILSKINWKMCWFHCSI